MYSTNLEECMQYLRVNKNDEFKQLMLDRARKLRAAGSDFLVICCELASRCDKADFLALQQTRRTAPTI